MTWRDLLWGQRKRLVSLRFEYLPPFQSWDAEPDLDLATWEWPR